MAMYDDILAKVREQLPRMTHARKCVLRCLCESDQPLAANDIQARLADDDVDAATIYRNLETLCQIGAVQKVEMSARGALFALTDNDHSHSIKCTECSCRVDIGDCFMAEVEALIQQRTGFDSVRHLVNFTGVCPQCRQPQQQ